MWEHTPKVPDATESKECNVSQKQFIASNMEKNRTGNWLEKTQTCFYHGNNFLIKHLLKANSYGNEGTWYTTLPCSIT